MILVLGTTTAPPVITAYWARASSGPEAGTGSAAATLALACARLADALLCADSLTLCTLAPLPDPDNVAASTKHLCRSLFLHHQSLCIFLPACSQLLPRCTFSAAAPALLRVSQHALALQVAVLYEGAGGLSPIPADAAAGSL
jgi:hypothetical protein